MRGGCRGFCSEEAREGIKGGGIRGAVCLKKYQRAFVHFSREAGNLLVWELSVLSERLLFARRVLVRVKPALGFLVWT